MHDVFIAVIILLVIGAVCAVILAIASKYLAVPTDEKFDKIRECLPGANCGACGYAGCDGYAGALASGEETKTNKCVAGGNEVAKHVAELAGGAFEETVPMKAVVHCKGTCNIKDGKRVEFIGEHTCASAKLLYGGDGICNFGCIGYGDCTAVCPEQAINIINGVAHINTARCMGCGLCVKTCPKKIISVVPVHASTYVGCSNIEKGPMVRKICSAGCIGCGICMKNCESGAITLVNNLAVIDYSKCSHCGVCAEKCPTKCISR